MDRHRDTPQAPGLRLLAAAIALGWGTQALALETSVSGRVMAGSVWRAEERDPSLLAGLNAAAVGLSGSGSGGNADDANTNYARGDAVSTAVHGFLDLHARAGAFSALLRIKAWYDYGLIHDARPWGSVASRYAAGQPLSDAGAPRLSRFSGVALGEAWVQHSWQAGDVRLLTRLGQQDVNWGERSPIGGLDALNARDLPAAHRAGASPQEVRNPAPMLFERLELGQRWALEAWRQGRFVPTATDMCGTFWSMSDYLVSGCDLVMLGQPQGNDRARIQSGAVMERAATPRPDAAQFGFGLQWRPASGTELGLYHARYNSRVMFPGLLRSTRVAGPALVPGNPDGRNMAYFTEYPERLSVTGASLVHKAGRSSVYAEVAYRPRVPFMLSPNDVVPPFLNPSVPAILREVVNQVPPGGRFAGYDLHPLLHLQGGVQREWNLGGVALLAGAELVAKHSAGLPPLSERRYNRADVFGAAPVAGNCSVTTGDPARQCALRGFVTPDAFGYRLRFEARRQGLLPGLNAAASIGFSHDVKGSSGDFLLIEGRHAAQVALRGEYRQQYLAELVWQPNWGGDYNPAADRDTVALAVGRRF